MSQALSRRNLAKGAAWAGETGGVGAGQIDANKAKRAVSYAVNGLGQVGTELKRGLVLTQLHYPANTPSSQTVTFTFEQPVYSFSMPHLRPHLRHRSARHPLLPGLPGRTTVLCTRDHDRGQRCQT